MKALIIKSVIALVLTSFSLHLSGCRTRQLPFFSPREPHRSEPQWVFYRSGISEYDGEKVFLAVGVDSTGIGYRQRLENALNAARDRMKRDIRTVAGRIGAKIVDELDPTEDMAPRIRDVLDDATEKTAEDMAGRAEHVSTYESLLRREVFVKLILPLEKTKTYYRDLARDKLEKCLNDDSVQGEL